MKRSRGTVAPFRSNSPGPHGVHMTIGLVCDTAAVVALDEAFWRRAPTESAEEALNT